jgi:hypothetical protein
VLAVGRVLAVPLPGAGSRQRRPGRQGAGSLDARHQEGDQGAGSLARPSPTRPGVASDRAVLRPASSGSWGERASVRRQRRHDASLYSDGPRVNVEAGDKRTRLFARMPT